MRTLSARSLVNRAAGRFGYEINRLDSTSTMRAAIRRLAASHPDIQTVVDVGASDGRWSAMVRRSFPEASYLLFEALVEPHAEGLRRLAAQPNIRVVHAAAGHRQGTVHFNAADPFGGAASEDPFATDDVEVPMSTIDLEVDRLSLQGPFMVKLDTHGFELQVLAGAADTLHHTALLVIEAYNFELRPGALTFADLCDYLAERGFRVLDLVDVMRRPVDKALWQFDLVFARGDRPEYIVMDGGSTDDTLGVLRSYDDRVRRVSEPDAGQSDAIRRGFAMGSGEILAWLNADDLYTPGAVARAVAELVDHPEAGLVYGNAEFIDRTGKRYGRQMRRSWDYRYLLTRRNFVSQPATFFRRSAYEAVGGLSADLHFVMDYDLWLKLGQSYPVRRVQEVLALVRIYRTTKTNAGGLDRVAEIRRMVATHGRTRPPEWHYWDLVRESVRAALAATRGGKRRQAAGHVARAAPYVLHPMVIYSAARHVRWRLALAIGRQTPPA